MSEPVLTLSPDDSLEEQTREPLRNLPVPNRFTGGAWSHGSRACSCVPGPNARHGGGSAGELGGGTTEIQILTIARELLA
jgi:hypothetical protein